MSDENNKLILESVGKNPTQSCYYDTFGNKEVLKRIIKGYLLVKYPKKAL